jgi:hypothetical protein
MPVKNLLKKLIRRLLLALLYIVIIGVMLEIGLRVLMTDYVPSGHDSPRIWQYHPTYGWVGRPNIDAPFRQSAFSIRVQHNNLGQRDSTLLETAPRKKRMLIIGDSFVWCYGVESKDCFVDKLEQLHPEWDIINGGIAGTGTDQQYLYLRDKISELKPDVVLLLVIQNDFQDNTKPQHNNYFKPYFILENGQLVPHHQPVPSPTLQQSISRWITGRSYLYNIGQGVVSIMGYALRSKLGLAPVVYDPYAGFMFGQSFPLMQALLNAMVDTTEASGAKVVLAHGQMLVNLQLAVKKVADERSVPYHNLDRAFTGYVHKDYQIMGDAHWNAWGHELVANDMSRFLQETGIFQSP